MNIDTRLLWHSERFGFEPWTGIIRRKNSTVLTCLKVYFSLPHILPFSEYLSNFTVEACCLKNFETLLWNISPCHEIYVNYFGMYQCYGSKLNLFQYLHKPFTTHAPKLSQFSITWSSRGVSIILNEIYCKPTHRKPLISSLTVRRLFSCTQLKGFKEQQCPQSI